MTLLQNLDEELKANYLVVLSVCLVVLSVCLVVLSVCLVVLSVCLVVLSACLVVPLGSLVDLNDHRCQPIASHIARRRRLVAGTHSPLTHVTP